MDTRKPKKLICEELGVGEALEAFRLGGGVPFGEDVLRHLFFHMWSMKKQETDVAAQSVVTSFYEFPLWKGSGLPLMTQQNAKSKVKQLLGRYREIRYMKKKEGPLY